VKITITLDPALVVAYQLQTDNRFLPRLHIATENVIKKLDGACSVQGRLLFNRPDAIRITVE
jgi:hypothetical protein